MRGFDSTQNTSYDDVLELAKKYLAKDKDVYRNGLVRLVGSDKLVSED